MKAPWRRIGVVAVIGTVVAWYGTRISTINQQHERTFAPQSEARLRKFPYPYRAALSISSDIDGTADDREFLSIQEFLCTKNMTKMGQGVGLEIGNTFIMYDTKERDYFSYFSSRSNDRRLIGEFARAGYLDLHSFGDGYEKREQARAAIEEMGKQAIRPMVWINHAMNPSNFGAWFPDVCQGDNPGSPYYHADLTVPYGLKFVWNYSSTSIIGQASPVSLGMIVDSFDPEYPLQSVKNAAIAAVKQVASTFGVWESRYALHAGNQLVRVARLDDGQKVYEFMRFDNHPEGIGYGAVSSTTAHNLSGRVFKKLVSRSGYLILYTHLGKNDDCGQDICEETVEALRQLEREFREGRIYVTTTEKLLRYHVNQLNLIWSSKSVGADLVIEISRIDDPVFGSFIPSEEDLQGMTFYVPRGKKVGVFINGRRIEGIEGNPADEAGFESVSFPLIYLRYPDLAAGR